MEYRKDIFPLSITAKMHFDFTARTKSGLCIKNISIHIQLDQHIRSNHAFAATRRSYKQRSVLHFNRDIPIICRYPTKLPHLMTYITNLYPLFFMCHIVTSYQPAF